MKGLPRELLFTPEGSQRPNPPGNLEHFPPPFPLPLSLTYPLCPLLSVHGMLARTQSEPTLPFLLRVNCSLVFVFVQKQATLE